MSSGDGNSTSLTEARNRALALVFKTFGERRPEPELTLAIEALIAAQAALQKARS
jgi:hypothetical protein